MSVAVDQWLKQCRLSWLGPPSLEVDYRRNHESGATLIPNSSAKSDTYSHCSSGDDNNSDGRSTLMERDCNADETHKLCVLDFRTWLYKSNLPWYRRQEAEHFIQAKRHTDFTAEVETELRKLRKNIQQSFKVDIKRYLAHDSYLNDA